jgi:hypothetical protein
MNKISSKETKNKNSYKLIKKLVNDDKKLQKQLNINSFNIIELNEEEISPENDPDLNIFSEREIQRIKKKAISIEEYYSNGSEDAKITENCFNCLMNNFRPNELLYFSKRKDLLTYLKYCFYFLKNILFLDYHTYIKNRFDLDKCDINYLNGWKFFIPKTVCRACFLQIINMEHLFGNLKTIFSDIDINLTSRNMRRNRSHFNPRIRTSHSARRYSNNHHNENTEERKNIIVIPKKESKIKIKNSKNNQNITYDDKKGVISIKKDILGDIGILPKKWDNFNKSKKSKSKKNNSEFNSEKSEHKEEQSLAEIKIKAKEYLFDSNENKKLTEKKKSKSNNDNSKKKHIVKNDNNIKELDMSYGEKNNDEIQKTKNSNSNDKDINKNNSIKDNLFSNHYSKNTNNQDIKEKIGDCNPKNKNVFNIYHEILNVKNMTNKIVMKLDHKLKSMEEIIIYTIINMGDFKDKLYNSINFNPNIISFAINNYEQYFKGLIYENDKARKAYKEIIIKVKNESIPSIYKNILYLKEEEKLKEEDLKQLDEMEKNLNDYSQKIEIMEKRYEECINNYFINFLYFFKLLKEITDTFA